MPPKLDLQRLRLSRLLIKDAKCEWDDPQERDFQTLKKCLVNVSELVLYDPGKEIKFYTDAGFVGIGWNIGTDIGPREGSDIF